MRQDSTSGPSESQAEPRRRLGNLEDYTSVWDQATGAPPEHVKTRHLTAEGKKDARVIRQLGACETCKQKHGKVSQGTCFA